MNTTIIPVRVFAGMPSPPPSLVVWYARSQPRLQAQVDVGAISGRMEDFQVQGAMCLGASLAQYGEVGKYSKYRWVTGGGGGGGADWTIMASGGERRRVCLR